MSRGIVKQKMAMRTQQVSLKDEGSFTYCTYGVVDSVTLYIDGNYDKYDRK